MLDLDTVTYAMTRDNAAGPIIQMVDNGIPPSDVSSSGTEHYAQSIGYMIAYAIAFAFAAYFIFV